MHTAAISACSASLLRISRRPLASARSISAASRVACAEPAPLFSGLPAGSEARRGWVRLTAGCTRFAAVFACGRRALLAAAVLGEDINLVPFLDHFVFAQLELAVRHAFAGLHVVFVAVPRAHEMHLGVGEVEALRGLVGHEPLLDLGDGEAFAGGTALVHAEIAVGVELALVPEYADLVVPGKDDAAVAVLELSGLPDVLLGHAAAPPWYSAGELSRVLGTPGSLLATKSAPVAVL